MFSPSPQSSYEDHSHLNDKKIEDLSHEISKIKDKLPNVQLLEDQLEGMKRQFTALKG